MVGMVNYLYYYYLFVYNFFPQLFVYILCTILRSPCSTTCGKGYELRTRRFYNRMGRKKCPHVDTMERRNCAGSVAVCPTSYSERYGGGILANPDCAVTSWSDWSPCSVSCGKGLKVRTRLYMVSPEQQSNVDCKVKLMEKGTYICVT